MKKYTNYCTQEQTLRAHNLGATLESGIAHGGHWIGEEHPFIYREPEPDCIAWNNSSCWFCPTTQQMIGWLREEKGLLLTVAPSSWVDKDYKPRWAIHKKGVVIGEDENFPHELRCGFCDTPEQAELAAIDAVLDYLEKEKTK